MKEEEEEERKANVDLIEFDFVCLTRNPRK